MTLMVFGTIAFCQLSSTQMQQVKTYDVVSVEDGKRIEVYDKDIAGGNQNFNDAKTKCAALGNGWRLPNVFELKSMVIQLKDKNMGNFYPGVYWSNEIYRKRWYWSVDFGSRDNNSYCDFFDIDTKLLVRPVRDAK